MRNNSVKKKIEFLKCFVLSWSQITCIKQSWSIKNSRENLKKENKKKKIKLILIVSHANEISENIF